MKNAVWTYKSCGFGITLYAPNGQSVWLQGDEAYDLIDVLDNCETEEQEQFILDAYSVLL